MRLGLGTGLRWGELVKATAVVRAMRKHLAWYVADLPSYKELRTQLFAADTYADVEGILRRYEETPR